jgi:hypothetical protein
MLIVILCYTDGTEIWVAAEDVYNEWVLCVENQIIARLRDWLGTARNANEMFWVFSKFNVLFMWPKVSYLGCYLSLMLTTALLCRSEVLYRNIRPN